MKYLFRTTAEFLRRVLNKVAGAWKQQHLSPICALYYFSSNFPSSFSRVSFWCFCEEGRSMGGSFSVVAIEWSLECCEWGNGAEVLFTISFSRLLCVLSGMGMRSERNLKRLYITFFLSIIQFTTFYYYIPIVTTFLFPMLQCFRLRCRCLALWKLLDNFLLRLLVFSAV